MKPDELQNSTHAKTDEIQAEFLDLPWVLCKIPPKSAAEVIMNGWAGSLCELVYILTLVVIALVLLPFKALWRLAKYLVRSVKPVKDWRNMTDEERKQDLKNHPW